MKTLVTALVAVLWIVAAVHAADDDLKDLKPGTKVIVDFGGDTVGEFLEYTRTGGLKVRIVRAGRPQELTFPPRKIRLAKPTDVVAGEDVNNLQPGRKVIVDWSGDTVGEFIKYAATGWLEVRVINKYGREQTPVFPPNKVRLADPKDEVGKRFGAQASADIRRPPMPPAMPKQSTRPEAPKSAVSSPTTAAPAGSSEIDSATAAELRPLIGSWQVVRAERDGKPEPGWEPFKMAFTTSEYYVDPVFVSRRFQIDGSTSPKVLVYHLDAGGVDAVDKRIYEIVGDELHLCSGFELPTDFTTKPRDGRQLLICKRCPDISRAPVKGPPEVNADLAATLNEYVALLDAKQFAAFFERSTPPENVRKVPAEKRNNSGAIPDQVLERMTRLFRALQRVIPSMNADGTKAEFNLTGSHVDGVYVPQIVTFQKINGKWYLGDDDFPGSELTRGVASEK